MTGLALAILIAYGVGIVWDLVEPDAVTVRFNSPARLLFAVCMLLAVITLCLLVVL